MSYILDALRKSESERRQGRVPDLGQQVQLIHKPKKKSSMVLAWVGVGLVLNAVVLAYIFWPSPPTEADSQPVVDTSQSTTAVDSKTKDPEPNLADTGSEPEPAPVETEQQVGVEDTAPEPQTQERPTIIVPSKNRGQTAVGSNSQQVDVGSVPHLVELPMPFQKTVPDLVFNSHIYASDPSSRRVMINNQYLKAGDVFSGIRVDQITEEGVVLSKNGRRFRVGSVRDWVSPQ